MFYKDLYENKDDLRTGQSIEDYIGVEGRDIAPKLEARTAESIEGEITLAEIWDILKKSNDNSAPGLTGMGYSFFKDYWPIFGNLWERTFNESFTNNFRKWIRVCLSNFYASTSHADNISEQFAGQSHNS